MGSFAEMSYRIDRHISTKGTRLQSYQIVPFERLVARFGEPRAGDGVSTIYQWVFSDDGGNVYTLYDWKATTMYKRDLVTPAKLRDLPEYKWHIGATPGITTNHFKAWIQDETLAKSPDVNVIAASCSTPRSINTTAISSASWRLRRCEHSFARWRQSSAARLPEISSKIRCATSVRSTRTDTARFTRQNLSIIS